MNRLLSLLFICLLSACASKPISLPALENESGSECYFRYETARNKDVLGALSTAAKLYEKKCFEEVVVLGSYIDQKARDKVYLLLSETAEFVLPDGSVTEYVLESYERAYLNYLVASSYAELKKQDRADVHLRKAYLDGKALIYNHGDDPVNLILQATLWENANQNLYSRPLWKRASELTEEDINLKSFTEKRLKSLDEKKPTPRWKVYTYGNFPQITWKMNTGKKGGGYFDLTPKSSFPLTCTSKNSLLISTEAWFKKISIRHNRDYHPLLNLRSWTRLPVGLTMGAITGLAGVGVGVGGCGLAVGIMVHSSGGNSGEAAGQLCSVSMKAAGAMIETSGDVVSYVLSPDLRRWEQVPSAFLITTLENPHEDPCYPQDSFASQPIPNK